jgi:uncharacterized protein DUF4383
MVRRIALVFGIVFLLVGLLGFIMPGPGGIMDMAAEPPAAMLLGMFPVNFLHNLVHLLFGVWGLVASRSFTGAQTFAKVGGVIYVVLALLGLVSASTFGFIPIGGNNIWLHALLGIVLAYFGFTAKAEGMAPAAPRAA